MDGKKALGVGGVPNQRGDGARNESKSMGHGSKEPQVKLFVKSVEKVKQHQKGEKEKGPMEVILSDNEETKTNDVVVILSDNEEEQRDTVQKLPISDRQYFGSLPESEQKHLKKHCLSQDELQTKSVTCTGCKKTIDFKVEGNLFRHPVLAVPVCDKCHQFYCESKWTKDEEGYHEHCRWCANGGEMMLCDSCENVFCQRCIRRNLGRSKVKEIEEAEEWNCLVCDPTQIRSLRSLYYSIWTIKEKKRVEETKNTTEKLNRDLSARVTEDALKNKLEGDETVDKEESPKMRRDDAKNFGNRTHSLGTTLKDKDAVRKTSLKGPIVLGKFKDTSAATEIVGEKSKEGTTVIEKKVIEDSQILGATNSGTAKMKPTDEGEKKKDEAFKKANVDEGANTSKSNAKMAFMEDTLRDGFDVNKIFGDYLKKADKSWGQKKDEELGEESLVKLVVKMRTIVKITHHNLELLDANLVAGCLKSFPGLDRDRLNPLTIEGEQEKQQQEEKKLAEKDKDVAEESSKHSKEDKRQNQETEKDEKIVAPQHASVGSTSKTKEEEKLSEEEEKVKPSSNVSEEKETSTSSKSEKANLDRENLAARAVVLQSTSSESDQAIIETEDDTFSPRKKLRTKKELDNIRRKSVAKTADDSLGNNVDVDEISNGSSSSGGGSTTRKSGEERVMRATNDFSGKTSDDSDEDRPGVVASSAGKKKGKKMPGPASAKRAGGEKESESDSDNEANREEERQRRLTIGKLQKLRDVAASIDPKNAKLRGQNLRVDIKALGADINFELSKSNQKVCCQGENQDI